MSTAPAEREPGLPLVRVRDLHKSFRVGTWSGKPRPVQAVAGVSLDVAAGETVALVGESGCGKSTVGRIVLRLLEPDAGEVRFEGTDVLALPDEALRRLRPRMQVVFQDPFGSLNPRLPVEEIVGEALRVHGLATGAAYEARLRGVLDRVGLPDGARGRYPHEFSGGQRQRIGIARALVLAPRFIVCDEAVSALDVSVQGQILNLLADIQADTGVAYLFISHDLAVVRQLAHRIAVMYLGKLMESGPAERVLASPRHPYTQALLAAQPVPDPAAPRPRLALGGEPPSPVDPPRGCPFHPRCPHAIGVCAERFPAPFVLGSGRDRQLAWCHRAGETLSPAAVSS